MKYNIYLVNNNKIMNINDYLYLDNIKVYDYKDNLKAKKKVRINNNLNTISIYKTNQINEDGYKKNSNHYNQINNKNTKVNTHQTKRNIPFVTNLNISSLSLKNPNQNDKDNEKDIENRIDNKESKFLTINTVSNISNNRNSIVSSQSKNQNENITNTKNETKLNTRLKTLIELEKASRIGMESEKELEKVEYKKTVELRDRLIEKKYEYDIKKNDFEDLKLFLKENHIKNERLLESIINYDMSDNSLYQKVKCFYNDDSVLAKGLKENENENLEKKSGVGINNFNKKKKKRKGIFIKTNFCC